MIAKCPSCGKTYNVDDAKAGKVAKCACGNKFVLAQEEPLALSEEPPAVEVAAEQPPTPSSDQPASASSQEPPSSPQPQEEPPPDPFRRPLKRPVIAAYPDKKPVGKIILLSLGGVLAIGAAVAIWSVCKSSGSSGGTGHKTDLTVQEFKDRIAWEHASILPRYDLATFTGLVGEPERVTLLGYDAHLFYICKDGKIHIIADKTLYTDQKMLLITRLIQE